MIETASGKTGGSNAADTGLFTLIVQDKVDWIDAKVEAEKTKDTVSIDLSVLGQPLSKRTMLRLDRLIEGEEKCLIDQPK